MFRRLLWLTIITSIAVPSFGGAISQIGTTIKCPLQDLFCTAEVAFPIDLSKYRVLLVEIDTYAFFEAHALLLNPTAEPLSYSLETTLDGLVSYMDGYGGGSSSGSTSGFVDPDQEIDVGVDLDLANSPKAAFKPADTKNMMFAMDVKGSADAFNWGGNVVVDGFTNTYGEAILTVTVEEIPEPSTVTMTLLGVAALLTRRFRSPGV